eukprot:CAMPEP_0194220214 /NCGR_PEP_ID=MMETSP0156-20130528/27760_1 /TAXON_ID=33649 /ORGANISM="Thalassionema nitzschioides, Strain L26-B" /LENGTH=226 /DNA_ID=CAMNT_0038950157 /DNA_START=108 /DNA_END=784 /DNA_ORIENTATION=-
MYCTTQDEKEVKRIHISFSESSEEEALVKKRKRRRVHFAPALSKADVCVQVKVIPLKSEEEKRTMFYTQKERYKVMRRIQRIVSDITEEGNYYQRGFVHNQSYGYAPIICRAFQSCCTRGDKLTSEELHCLKYHLTKIDSRRGLEKYIVAGLGEQKRRNTIMAVVDRYSAAMTDHGYVSNDVKASITKIYSDRTDGFKRFAFLKGHMDELAAKIEVDDVPVRSGST